MEKTSRRNSTILYKRFPERPSVDLSGDWFSFVRSIEIALDREKDQAGRSQFTIKVKKTTSTTRN
jgi:hypothetical protein